MTSGHLFLTVTRELLVLHFAPNQITKLSMDVLAGEKVNGTGVEEYEASQFFKNSATSCQEKLTHGTTVI